MIRKKAIIQNVEQTVVSPIINEINRVIIDKIIKDKNAFINLESMYEKENVSVPDNIYDNPIGGSTINISYETITNEDFSVQNSYTKPMNKIILLDRHSKVSIRPNYLSNDLTLTYKYRTQSKTKVLDVKNRLVTYYNNSNYRLLFNIPYSFMLPNNVLALLDNIRKLKSIGNLKEYIDSISVFQLDYITTKTNKHFVPVFRGIQNGRIGTFGNINPRELVIQKDESEYSIEFECNTSFDKPVELNIVYPIMVNNKPLDKLWIPKEEAAKPILNSHNELDIGNIYKTILGNVKNTSGALLRVPNYDIFNVNVNNDMYNIQIMSILLTIDDNDPCMIFNLDDLKYMYMPERIIEYLKKTDETSIFNLNRSLFNLELYEFEHIRDLGLKKTDNNDIITTTPMDKDKTYRLLISMITTIDLIKYENDEDMVNDIILCKDLNMPFRSIKSGLVYSI